MENGQTTVAAVGDLLITRSEPDSIFAHCSNIMRGADITFGQLETSYSDKGSKGSSGPRGANNKDPRNYCAIPNAGFDVISLASNHAMDWGEDALLDCIERLQRDSIAVVGAGADIAAARKPAIIERNGTRIAFLAYCSVAPKGYYAAEYKSGVAPMRAVTLYEAFEEDQPGTPCEILTYPHAPDLERLVEDIKRARKEADVVAVSLHWGVHHIRAVIADYQPVVAHAAIDAGADIILGHHPHMLKGIEVYKEKAILYSLGNFAFDMDRTRRNNDYEWNERRKKVFHELYRVPEPARESVYRFQPDSRYSVIAKIVISARKIERVSLIPVMINDQAQPVPVSPLDKHGKDVIGYLTGITKDAGLNATYAVAGEEIAVSA
jgi:poly-gamma-glutamate capsule biosynthesis protein CapA/YwtB (metallophosphatase superfamily)